MSVSTTSIKKSIVSLSFAFYVVLALSYFKSILIAKPLTTEEFAVFVALRLVLGFAYFTDLGLINVLMKMLPMYLVNNENEKARKLSESVFSLLLINSIGVAVVSLVLTYFFKSKLNPSTYEALLVAPVIMIFQQVYGYYVGVLRGSGRFNQVAISRNIVGGVDFVVTVSCIYTFGLWGIYLAFIVSNICGTLYLIYTDRVIPKFSLDFSLIKPLYVNGLGFFFNIAATLIFTTLDKIIVSKNFSLQIFGIYGFLTILIVQGVVGISDSLGTVMYTHFNQLFGAKGKSEELVESYNKSNLVILIALPILILSVALFTVLIISLFLPKYSMGIPLIPLVILVSFFQGISSAGFMLYTINKHQVYVLGVVAFVITYIVIYWTGIVPMHSITNILWTTIVLYFLAQLFCFVLAYDYFNLTAMSIFKKIAYGYAPFVFLYAVYYILFIWTPLSLETTAGVISFFIRCGIVAVVYLIFLLRYLTFSKEGRALKEQATSMLDKRGLRFAGNLIRRFK